MEEIKINKEEQINVIIRKAVQIFNEDTLREKLKSNKKLVVKFGADPSRPDLHLGHTHTTISESNI